LKYFKEENNYRRLKGFTKFKNYFYFAFKCETIKKTCVSTVVSVKQYYKATSYDRNLWSLRSSCSIESLLKNSFNVHVILN